MATPKQVMDFRPSKGITTAQSNEHQRRWTEKGWGSAESTGNYDRSRERLNFEVRGGVPAAHPVRRQAGETVQQTGQVVH